MYYALNYICMNIKKIFIILKIFLNFKFLHF